MSRKPLATTITDAVTALQGQLTGLRGEVEGVRTELEMEHARPVPPAVATARVDAAIAGLRDQAAASLSVGDIVNQGAYGLVGTLTQSRLPPFVVAAVLALEGLRAWLLKQAETVMQRLPEPATADETASRIVELARQLRAVEDREAALCWEAEAAGIEVAWRGDMDPLAVLGLPAEEADP